MADENDLATLLKGAVNKGKEGEEAPPAASDDIKEGEGEGDLRGDNTRLRQQVAQLQDLNQRALPFVKLVTTLGETEPGKAVIRKFQAGEDFSGLLKAEQKVVEEAAKETPGLTVEQVKEIVAGSNEELVQKVTEGVAVQRQSEKNVEALDKWATEKFPGYENLTGTPVWNGLMDSVFAAIRNGTWAPAEGEDPWKFAIGKAYAMAVVDNPEIAKGTKKAAAATPEEKAAEILSSGRKPPSSKALDTKDEIPEKYKRDLEFIRNLKKGPIAGKSFANPQANKEESK